MIWNCLFKAWVICLLFSICSVTTCTTWTNFIWTNEKSLKWVVIAHERIEIGKVRLYWNWPHKIDMVQLFSLQRIVIYDQDERDITLPGVQPTDRKLEVQQSRCRYTKGPIFRAAAIPRKPWRASAMPVLTSRRCKSWHSGSSTVVGPGKPFRAKLPAYTRPAPTLAARASGPSCSWTPCSASTLLPRTEPSSTLFHRPEHHWPNWNYLPARPKSRNRSPSPGYYPVTLEPTCRIQEHCTWSLHTLVTSQSWREWAVLKGNKVS